MTPLYAIILAAGESVRMNSKTPKVLLDLAGQPMLEYALQNAEAAMASKIFLVVDSKKGPVASYAGKRVVPVVQPKPLGTGNAVMQCLSLLKSFKGNLLILYGDVPLLRPQTLRALRQFHEIRGASATLLTAVVENPFGYGRILRDHRGEVQAVVEENDATDAQRRIREINAGGYLFKAPVLAQALKATKARKADGHTYLTDCAQQVLGLGGKLEALTVPDSVEILGVNDREQFGAAHRVLNLRRVEEFQREGASFLDPGSVELGPEVMVGRDCVIEGNVKLAGTTVLAEDCRVESGSVLVNAKLGKGVVVRSSRITDSSLGDGCDAGPNAHLRGGCELDRGVHVGTGAEMKGVKAGSGSKAGHFCYVGDAVLGRDVNIGAGCVFANFDGKKKHPSTVGDGAFLGSNSTLVAPVKVGKKAVVGAGAVVTKDVAPGTVVAGVPAKELKKK